MRVVVNIPSELVDQIRSAIEQGNYAGPEEFLEQALHTQLRLESDEKQILTSFSEAVQPRSQEFEQSSFEGTLASEQAPGTNEDSSVLEDLSVRDFDVLTVDPPSPSRIDTGPLWGQYNRILPMKVSVRRLAIELDKAGAGGIAYDEFREQTAAVARAYGHKLKEIDKEAGRGRGEKFSAGFPTGDKVESSLNRFKTHFVGQIDSTGSLTGSLPNLQFVNISPSTREFGLTDAGLDFARVENPVLDQSLRSDNPLSESERRFYLDHVNNELHAEHNAMELVAEAILGGVNRPDPLSERVAELSEDWTSAQASTIRSGLIGRMNELSLVSRKRVGTRGVGYELTVDGKRELL
jgi:Arc/MetJ-type ribon-helix-helix transcriptional regulator